LSKISQSIPNTFLSLHGGSGIPADQVQEAIKRGKIVKVNVNTELRVVYKDSLTEEFGENPNQYKVYEYADRIILAVAAVVEAKIDVFGSADKI
jgi:fructose-bisphosphate aldolase class II